MNVHRITLIVVDTDQLGAESVRGVLENQHYPNYCIAPMVQTIETRDCGTWNDQHPLNRTDTYQAEVDRLFGAQADLLQTLRLIQHATAPTPADGGHHEAAHELATTAIAKATGGAP